MLTKTVTFRFPDGHKTWWENALNFFREHLLEQEIRHMKFKKGEKVTTPSGGGIVFADQTTQKVEVLINATDKVETFEEEKVDHDSSEGNTREVWD